MNWEEFADIISDLTIPSCFFIAPYAFYGWIALFAFDNFIHLFAAFILWCFCIFCILMWKISPKTQRGETWWNKGW